MRHPTSPRNECNDLHDAYVQAVNAALAAGREHVARELADSYDDDRDAAQARQRRLHERTAA